MWEKRKQRQKSYIKTKASKEYQKNYYLNNRDKKLRQSKISKNKRKITAPLKLLLGSCRHTCKNRVKELEFEIDLEYLEELWGRQKGRCYYTGIEMKYIAHHKTPLQVSIDRMDSSLGYIKSNTVLCCQAINYCKNDYSINDFQDFFRKFKEALKLILDDRRTD